MEKMKSARLLALLLSAALLLGGCVSQASQNRPALRVGIVSLDRILPELPEYKQYSEQYQKDRMELFKDVKVSKSSKDLQKYMTPAKQQEIEKSVQKWDDQKRQFLEKTREKVKVASEKVAGDKGVDIVLVSAPWLPVSQRMAVDITTDVIYVLRDQGKTVH